MVESGLCVSRCRLALQVCVPIDPESADSFDPVDGVPTVSQLLGELADPSHAATDPQVS